jgi:NAD(P)H-dependent FMN reductase
MRIEVISGSPRWNSQTKRIALHLYNRLRISGETCVGMISLDEFTLPPVQDVFSAPSSAPTDMRGLAERIFNADGFILVSPEYNGSYSPAMKNFLDYFPKQTRKTFGIVTASPGGFGGIRAALQLQALTYGLMGIGSPQMLIVPEMDKKFDSNGELIDLSFKANVTSFIESFLWLSDAVVLARTEMTERKCA